MTTVLAFDLSSKSTGYALFKNNKLQMDVTGTIQLSSKTHGEQLCIFESQVKHLLETHNPDVVIIEEIWKGPNITTFKILSYYHGVMQKILWQWKKISPIMVMPSAARHVLADKYNVILFPPKDKTKKKKRGSKKKKVKTKPAKDSKELTFDFIVQLFSLKDFNFKLHNDITDAIALGLSYTVTNP